MPAARPKTLKILAMTPDEFPKLADVTRRHYELAVATFAHKRDVAKALGISLKTVYNLEQRYRLEDKQRLHSVSDGVARRARVESADGHRGT